MGVGSYFGRKVFGADVGKRLYVVSIAIVIFGILLFVFSPDLFAKSLEFELPLRAATTFLAILPLALLLGIPFPSCIQLLASGHNDRYIPWMYGVNGSMSVLGSVLAAILSMLYGFTPAYFVGLFFYLSVFVISFSCLRRNNRRSVAA
jgi:MFS family permease